MPEVGSGTVAIIPVFKGFRRATASEVDAATKDGTRRATQGFRNAGTESGRGFKETFSKSSEGTSEAIIKTLNTDIASASKALSAARLKEQDAAGQVRVAESSLASQREKSSLDVLAARGKEEAAAAKLAGAETALAAAIKKSGAESAAAVKAQARVVAAQDSLTLARARTKAATGDTTAAEERLAKATRGLSTAQDTTRAASDRLKGAQGQLTEATRVTTTETTKSAGGFRRFFAGVGAGAAATASGLRGAFSRAFTGLQGIAARSFDGILRVARTTGVVIGSILGAALVGGFSRMSNIENAQAKLRGLGNTAESVQQIMDDALGAVRGTAFGLDEAATVAATAVAAGIKPGKELNKYLSLTADTATIAGTSLSDMGSIMNKMTTSGTVYTDSLNELADRGIPVFQYLQKEYGVSAEKLNKMVQDGKVDAKTLRKVLEENLGGAALESGNTTTGAFKNMLAALSRVGAGLLSTVFPYFKDFFGSVTVLFDALGPTSKRVGESIGNALRPGLEAFTRITDKIGELASSDEGLTFSGLRDAFPALDKIAGVLERGAPAMGLMSDAFKQLGPTLAPLLPQLAESGEKLLPALVDAVVELTPSLVELLPQLVELGTVALPVFAAVLTNLVVPALEAVLPFVSSVFDGISLMIDYLKGDLTPQGYINALNAILDTLGPLGAMQQETQRTVGLIIAAFNFMGAAIGVNVNAVIGFFNQWRDQTSVVVGWFNSAMGGLPLATGAAVAGIAGWLLQLPGKAGQAVAGVVGWFLRMPPQMAAGAGQAVGMVIGILAGLPPRAVAAIGDLSGLLFGRGVSLVQGFARGILSSIGTVTSAVSRVLSVVPDFFPNSPAKRGPLSGAGWRKIGRSGGVIADQFTNGLPTGSALDPYLSRVVAPGVAAAARVGTPAARGAGGVNIGNVYAFDTADLVRQLDTRQRMAAMAGGRA